MWPPSPILSILASGSWFSPFPWLGFTPVMVSAPSQALDSAPTLILALTYFKLFSSSSWSDTNFDSIPRTNVCLAYGIGSKFTTHLTVSYSPDPRFTFLG